MLKLPWIIVSKDQEDVSSGNPAGNLPGRGGQPLPYGLPDEFYEHQLGSQTHPYQNSSINRQGYPLPNEWGRHQMNAQADLGQRHSQPDGLPDEWYEHQRNTLDNPGGYEDPMAFDNNEPDERFEYQMSTQERFSGQFQGQQGGYHNNDWYRSNKSGTQGVQRDYVGNYSRLPQPKHTAWNVPDPMNTTWTDNNTEEETWDETCEGIAMTSNEYNQPSQYFNQNHLRGQNLGGESWQTSSQLGTCWTDQVY